MPREHGIYISALDVAFETTKALTEDDGTYDAVRTSGRSISWACGALLYGAARFAERKADMKVEPIIWNTLRRALVMRMMEASEQLQADPELGRAQQIQVEYRLRKEAEDEGYKITEQLDAAVERVLSSKDIMPAVLVLAPLFGLRDDNVSRLRLHFVRLADEARTKVIPDFISELGF